MRNPIHWEIGHEVYVYAGPVDGDWPRWTGLYGLGPARPLECSCTIGLDHERDGTVLDPPTILDEPVALCSGCGRPHDPPRLRPSGRKR